MVQESCEYYELVQDEGVMEMVERSVYGGGGVLDRNGMDGPGALGEKMSNSGVGD